MQITNLVFYFYAKNINKLTQITCFSKGFCSSFRIRYDHADNAIFSTVIDNRTENVDILFCQKTGDILNGTFLVLRVYGYLF